MAAIFMLFLTGCAGTGAGPVRDIDAALTSVPGVESAHTQHHNRAGMSTRINVRITSSPGAELETVLDESLQAFAGASGSTRGSISVAYYVFTDGDEENGIRPDALGLKITPTVDEIRHYAASGTAG